VHEVHITPQGHSHSWEVLSPGEPGKVTVFVPSEVQMTMLSEMLAELPAPIAPCTMPTPAVCKASRTSNMTRIAEYDWRKCFNITL